MLTYQNRQLSSGLQLVTVPMPSAESVTVLVLCNTGARYEAPHQFGIAHFFEHMVFKGTAKYPQPQDLSITVDGIGADFNAFTGKEYTGYYVRSASQHWELAMDVVSDMLLTPRLRQGDIDREIGVIKEELNMYVDNPSRHIGNVFEQMVFRGNGLGHDIVGTKETVSQMTSADFQSFLQEWYGLSNLVLVVGGDASVVGDTDRVLEMAEKMFSKETNGERAQGRVDLKLHMAGEPISGERLHVEERATEQAHFVLGWPAIERTDSRRYAARILNSILGASMSSRLFNKVREELGLCYYINSYLDTYHTQGLMGAAAGVDIKRIHEALEVTIDQFMRISDGRELITDIEVARAKDYISGKTALGLEETYEVAEYIGLKQLMDHKIETPDQVLAKVRKVTTDEVNQAARDFLTEHQLRLAVIGPFSERAAFEKLITNW
jgi:predicted Zn-dependent peptidase